MSSKTKERVPKAPAVSEREAESDLAHPSASTIESPSPAISSPASKLSVLAKLLKSPRHNEEQSGKKKTERPSRSKVKSKNAGDGCSEVKHSTGKAVVPKVLLSEHSTTSCGTDLPKQETLTSPMLSIDKRSMVQTRLSMTKGGIQLLSNPEQSQMQTKKGKKNSSKRQDKSDKKQTRISNIFPVRKSSRMTESEQKKHEEARITKAILSKTFEGLEVCSSEGKGRGVYAYRVFTRNEFVCEYTGELITFEEAKKREKIYSEDKNIGCYMYYLDCNNKKYCVDATAEDGTYGRLLNHSRSGNCKTKIHMIKDTPHLIFVAQRNIKCGEELTYDYGDRSKDAIDSHPWLKY